jgi:hypothetical protein
VIRRQEGVISGPIEHKKSLPQVLLVHAHGAAIPLRDLAIRLHLFEQVFASLLGLMAMVEVLHCLFEANGDQQSDHDCRDADKEILPGVDGWVGSVYVEHGR